MGKNSTNFNAFTIRLAFISSSLAGACALGCIVLALLLRSRGADAGIPVPIFWGVKIVLWLGAGYSLWAMQRFHHLAKTVSRAMAASGTPEAWDAAIAWSFSGLENEPAFRQLQRDHLAMAERLRFHGRYAGRALGMLALLPGVKWLLELRLVWRFRLHPGLLRLHPHIQAYVWGQPPDRSWILKFLNQDPSQLKPQDRIAELWVGAHKKNPAVVQDGRLFMDLDRFAPVAGRRLLGPGRKKIRPLFKILDAAQPLSWQMHERTGPEAKCETWMMILPKSGKSPATASRSLATIYIGFRPLHEVDFSALSMPGRESKRLQDPDQRRAFYRDLFHRHAEDSSSRAVFSVSNCLEVRQEKGRLELFFNGRRQTAAIKRRFGVDRGMLVVHIPGATLHGLGQGCLFELQDMADKTLRVYDYGRRDPRRPLQIDEAMERMECTPRLPEDYLVEPGEWEDGTQNLICTPAYALDRLLLPGRGSRDVRAEDACQLWVATDGSGQIQAWDPRAHDWNRHDLVRGEIVLIPAAVASLRLTTSRQMEVLKIYEPAGKRIQTMQAQRGLKFWETESRVA